MVARHQLWISCLRLPFVITYILPSLRILLHLILARQPTLRPGIEPGTLRLTVVRSNQLSYQSLSSFTSYLGSLPALGFEPRKHLQCILSAPPLTGLGYTGCFRKHAIYHRYQPTLSCVATGIEPASGHK